MRRTRHELYKFIDADYYGFRDEEDGVLAAVEGPAQEAMHKQVRGPVQFRYGIGSKQSSCSGGPSSGGNSQSGAFPVAVSIGKWKHVISLQRRVLLRRRCTTRCIPWRTSVMEVEPYGLPHAACSGGNAQSGAYPGAVQIERWKHVVRRNLLVSPVYEQALRDPWLDIVSLQQAAAIIIATGGNALAA